MLQVQDVSTLRGSVSHRHVPVKLSSTGATVFELAMMPVLLVRPRPPTSAWGTSKVVKVSTTRKNACQGEPVYCISVHFRLID
jgi:hypothetical protein